MKFFLPTLALIALTALTFIYGFASFTPGGRALFNQWFFAVQKADDATRYETRRRAEDTCRAMQASYEADRLAWEQYRHGEGERRGWADQARMRANSTAATYNHYILQNSFVWSGNVPGDIRNNLTPITD